MFSFPAPAVLGGHGRRHAVVGIVVGDGTGSAMTVPAVTVLASGNVVLIYVFGRQQARRRTEARTPANLLPRVHAT